MHNNVHPDKDGETKVAVQTRAVELHTWSALAASSQDGSIFKVLWAKDETGHVPAEVLASFYKEQRQRLETNLADYIPLQKKRLCEYIEPRAR